MKRMFVATVVAVMASAVAACSSSSKPAVRPGAPDHRGSSHHDRPAAHAQLLRGVEAGTGRLHPPDRVPGQARPTRRRGRDGQRGDPAQGQPGRRRAVRGRQHVPDPCARRRDLRPVRRPWARHRARRSSRSTRNTASRRSTTVTYASTTTSRGSVATGTRPDPRRSTTCSNRRTRTSPSSRTRRRRRPGSRSCSPPSPRTASSGWQGYWDSLKHNGVRVDDDWNQAYENDFTAGGGSGDRPIVVSYGSDPAADVIGSSPHRDTPNVGVIASTCFRQIEYRGRAARRAQRPGRAGACRLHADAAFPGRHAVADVRESGRERRQAAARVHQVGRRPAASATRCHPRRSRPTGTHGSRTGPTASCDDGDDGTDRADRPRRGSGRLPRAVLRVAARRDLRPIVAHGAR